MVAAESIGLYRKAANQRKVEAGKTHGRGQKAPANLPEPNSGDARDKAAARYRVSESPATKPGPLPLPIESLFDPPVVGCLRRHMMVMVEPPGNNDGGDAKLFGEADDL